jgi:hypothetical protein
MAEPARKKTEKMPSERTSKRGTAAGTRKQTRAGKLASMIEGHMSALGLSETEKNLRVSRFAQRVDLAIEGRAKS